MHSIGTEAILSPTINFKLSVISKSMSQNLNIPILTNLVTAGNPKLKISEEEKSSLAPQSANLNMRIDEIETAIGQDNTGPIGRAYAIRAEKQFENIDKHISNNSSK